MDLPRASRAESEREWRRDPGVAQHAEGTIVVGLDGHPKGWAGVALRDGRFERALAASTLQLLLDQVPEVVAD